MLNDAQQKLDAIEEEEKKDKSIVEETKTDYEKSPEQTLDLKPSPVKDSQCIKQNMETPSFSYQSPIQQSKTNEQKR